MEPLVIVTLLVATIFVVGRGGYVIAPRATADFYRRSVFSTNSRVRALGGALLVLVAVPLLVTVSQAPAGPGGMLVLLNVLGWLAAAAGLWVIAMPGVCRRLAGRFLEASDCALRIRGALGVAFGLFLGRYALFVL